MEFKMDNLVGTDGQLRQVRVTKVVGRPMWLAAGLETDTAPTGAPLSEEDALALSKALEVMATTPEESQSSH